jgi:indolepyruvate ferredoxin oxidoreductase alpha subunit
MNIVVLGRINEKVLMMGNEAIARGAIEAGVEFIAAYPGTPSSEIVETLAEISNNFDYYVEWSINEKVAFDVAAGASLIGARSLVVMKNAGLNVVMDTFMTLPYTGIKGGMVIVVADDPGAHYSSNEQDTRFAALYAEIPCLEPANQQEAKEMTKEAFEISEALELPVFLRSVTRLSHASGDVILGEIKKPLKKIGFNKHWKIPFRWNVYGPPGAVSKHRWLHLQMEKSKEIIEESKFNTFTIPANTNIGIIASGLGASYAAEAISELGLKEKLAFLKLGFANPLPEEKLRKILKGLKKIIVIEEGDPVIERQVRSFAQDTFTDIEIFGKERKQILNPYGELNFDCVAKGISKAIGLQVKKNQERVNIKKEIQKKVSPRSSTLCAGCPHLGTYWAVKKALQGYKGVHIVNGDIGCYEQGGYGVFSHKINPTDDNSKAYSISSPYEILDTIYVMGSGIGMAMGQSQAGYKDGKILAVAGDSTFFHATLPAVVNAVYTQADINFLILDNSWTCMTGHQPNPTTGKSVTGETTKVIDISKIVEIMGITCIRVVDPYKIEESIQAIQEVIDFKGPSVVIFRHECALQVQRREKHKNPRTFIDRDKCTGCKQCLRLGCPAIAFDNENKIAGIDSLLCVDCGLCNQICSFGAITLKEE